MATDNVRSMLGTMQGSQGSQGSRGSGGGPPDNGQMEARLAKIEAILPTLARREEQIKLEGQMREGFANVRADIAEARGEGAVMRSNYSTKEDLHKELHALSWRIIGAVITFGTLVSGIVYYIARNVY